MRASEPSPVEGDLPYIDEHRVLVSAPAPAVWRALADHLAHPRRPAGAYAHLVAADPRRTSGQLLDEGATVPGFAVADVVPEQSVRLAGRHLFSRYALVLTLEAQPDGTLLSARTYAEFPGLHGRAYRVLVIGSGAHRVMVGRILRDVRRRAES
ncbi:MAG: hypothetical protein ACRDPQ_15765 [Nocardioidaceae bacterium]